jgi:poly(A) polymerase/tRNA nucleotidyltransferase (CCA-adding enzyme)
MTGDAPIAHVDPPALLGQGAPAAVLAALPGARAVGGAVRDTLAGLAVHDVDIAAPLPPEAIAGRLRAAGLKVFETGLAHGTVTAVLDHQPVEVTSLRRDVVTDGRHAEVAWTTDWREDAARRDFTINAMSLSAEGALWDYFGGRDDLAAGRVRFVGDPATRLQEDFLRVLRFFRFQARYGRGDPDPAAMAAIRAAVPGLARLSVERVWMELKRLLEAPDPSEAMALMAGAGVLAAVLPEAADPPALRSLIAVGAPPDPVLRLAALVAFPPDARDAGLRRLAARLRLSRREATALRAMTAAPGACGLEPDMTEADLLPAMAEAELSYAELGGRQVIEWLLWLMVARLHRDRAPEHALQATRRLIAAARGLAPPVFPLAGRDAVAIGIQPGPRMGALLAQIRSWWIMNGCVADREACLARLRQLAASPAI